MKIKCSYCGNYFNDTLTQCPNCGAPNEAVVRTVKTQPMTIEELAKWYADRGLPPYETTRFFIGQDYRGKRAFGIYKDPNNGNFIVYKNKDSGERAIRYAGTDEAYAVNELFMRLKQEIIEQKRHNVEKKGGYNPPGTFGSTSSGGRSYSQSSSYRPSSSYTPRKQKGFLESRLDNLGCFGGCLYLLFLICAGIFILAAPFVIVSKISDSPATGYYQYEDKYMYYTNGRDHIEDKGWIEYDADTKTWDGVFKRVNYPLELRKNKYAKEFFLGEKWSSQFDCTDFLKSDEYITISGNNTVSTGYYEYDDTTYYHYYSGRETGWYSYDDDDSKWTPVEPEDVPSDLSHYNRAEDFFFTPTWDSSTQFSDFRDSEYYIPPSSSSSSSDDSNDSWWDNYDDDSSYDWDYGSSDWDSGSSDWDSDW